jgi:hypothetical protein
MLNNEFTFTKVLDTGLKDFLIGLLKNSDEANKSVFSEGSDSLKDFSNNCYIILLGLLNSLPTFKVGVESFFDEASKQIATGIATITAPIIIAHKDCLVPFVTTPARNNTTTSSLCNLVILGANFDHLWNRLLHKALPTGSSTLSLHSLTTLHHTINEKVIEQAIDTAELVTTNPFHHHDSNQAIPNPLTRKHALSDPNYEKRSAPKIYKR